jgi:glycosyltransferase involved in cell wall biosynthesis
MSSTGGAGSGIRVAISAVGLSDSTVGGLNRYGREVLRHLLPRIHDAVVYTAGARLTDPGENVVRRMTPARMSGSDLVGNSLRLWWHQARLPAELRTQRAEVFYSPTPDGMLRPPCPQVVTIHDLLPLHYPGTFPRLRHYVRHFFPPLLRASAAVITDSESTRRDIRSHFGSATPVHVIHPGYSSDVFQPPPAERCGRVAADLGLGDYVLAVGETRPYKNIARLIRAFAALPDRTIQLAIVGNANRFDRAVRELPATLHVADRVRFIGTVDDPTLAALYGGARLFAFPSLFEGFGIPPLEAMACGCPVLASNATSIPEVCGDAVVYADPLDVAALSRGMHQILGSESLRSELREAGLERVKAFSYDRTAAAILEVLERAAGGG